MVDGGKYATEEYLNADPFGGDDSDVRAHRVRVVRTRKKQFCCLCQKTKTRGTIMYRETAVVDGEWQSNYACLPCLDKHHLDECDKSGWPLKLKPPGSRRLRPPGNEGRIRELADRLTASGPAPALSASELHEVAEALLAGLRRSR